MLEEPQGILKILTSEAHGLSNQYSGEEWNYNEVDHYVVGSSPERAQCVEPPEFLKQCGELPI
jgi:hypothetical protein